MRISIIAAMARNRVIGTEAGLPWHLPRELKQFRTLTTGKPIVMGRTTFAHIGRPLPQRTSIVLSRQPDFAADGVLVAHSVAEALEVARREAERLGVDEVMVIGGAEVYRAFAPLADRLYLTVVEGDFAGTATFPLDLLAESRWAEVARQSYPADEKNPHAYTVWQFDRLADVGEEDTPLSARIGVR